MALTWEEALEHVGSLMTNEVEQRAIRAIPHYIWTQGDAQHRKGFCTSCFRWIDLSPSQIPPRWALNDPYMDSDVSDTPFETTIDAAFGEKVTGKTAHGDLGYCPGCGARIQYRSLAIGRKSLIDKRFLVMYQKSAIDSHAVVCVGYALYVPWGEWDEYESWMPPLEIEPRELCVFQYGHGGQRFIRTFTTDKWESRKKCISGWAPAAGCFSPGWQTILDAESFDKAICDTPFQRVFGHFDVNSTSAYDYFDKIALLDRLARYPCVEYLFRLGFDELACAVIDDATHGLLNLRGKTAQKVLRLTDQQWGEVKGRKLKVTVRMLEAIQYAKRENLRWSMELCDWIAKQSPYGTLEAIGTIREKYRLLDIGAALKYCRRKNVRPGDYRDYLGQMVTLRMSMADKALLYPANFDEMHARFSERISVIANRGLERKIEALLPKLTEYCFSACGLVLRPMLSAREVIREGTALHHCVGSYVKSYAGGGIVLCCLREEVALDAPLYTVEFGKSGQLMQCRGERNQTRPEDADRLAQFWKLFEIMRADLRAKPKRRAYRGKTSVEADELANAG